MRTSEFIRPQAMTDHIEAAGFSLLSHAVERRTQHYRDVLDLCFYLRDIGATNQHPNRPRGLLTPRKLREVAKHYPHDGEGITASWAVARWVGRKL
jgi:hypothetical protein